MKPKKRFLYKEIHNDVRHAGEISHQAAWEWMMVKARGTIHTHGTWRQRDSEHTHCNFSGHTHGSHHLCLHIFQVTSCLLYRRSQTRSSHRILKVVKQKDVFPFVPSERWMDLGRGSRWKHNRVETCDTEWFSSELFTTADRTSGT